MSIRWHKSPEDRVVDAAFELAREAQDVAVSKRRFAEILDEAWDAAKAEELEMDRRTEITLRP